MSYPKHIQPGQFDWLSFSVPDDIHAPHPDVFEFELDNSLTGIDQSKLQYLDFSSDSYTYYRGDTAGCGPGSTITISSDSALESPSASLYGIPQSPTYSSLDSMSTYSSDLRINFAKFSVDCPDAPVAAPQPINAVNTLHLIDDTDADTNSFGELPVSSFSSSLRSVAYDFDSTPSLNSINQVTPPEFFVSSQPRVAPAPQPAPRSTSTITPISLPLPIPRLTLPMNDSQSSSNEAASDSRRKYQCPSCPRAFARAYNLKTHMATHDPHRLKPFACPHKSCGRSFSRKHDLGRHLVSIHHDDPDGQKIGVQSGSRTWCDSCGKGWTSASSSCGCAT